MKVLVFTNIYPNHSHPYFGVFVKNQIESLIKTSPSDCYSILAIKTKKAGGKHINYLYSFLKLFYLRLFSRVDVIHCHHAFCVFMAKCLFFKNIVYTNHEGEFFKGGFVEKIKLRAISWADNVIFVNLEMKNRNVNLCKRKSYLLPCAVDREYFINNKSKLECRAILNLDADARIIFFPANPSRVEKNYSLLVDSLSYWDFNLHGKKPIIIYGGSIEYKDIWIWYTACDVVVSCSKYESDGMIYKEAIICNTFFISPNVGNAKMYTHDGQCGSIFESYEPSLLLSDLVCFFNSFVNEEVINDKVSNDLELISDQAIRLRKILYDCYENNG